MDSQEFTTLAGFAIRLRSSTLSQHIVTLYHATSGSARLNVFGGTYYLRRVRYNVFDIPPSFPSGNLRLGGPMTVL